MLLLLLLLLLLILLLLLLLLLLLYCYHFSYYNYYYYYHYCFKSQNLKKIINYFSQINLNHKTPKISPWAYIFQTTFLVGIYSGVGGYNFVPRVSCLSDIRLDRRPISEKQQTPQARLGGVIIGLHKCIYIYIYIYITYIYIHINIYIHIYIKIDR